MTDRATNRAVRRGATGVPRPAVTIVCVLLAVLLTGWCWSQSAAAAQKEKKGRRAAAEKSKPATDESAKAAEKEKSGAKAKGKRARQSRTGQADSPRLEADDLRYLPDDCRGLGWVDVEGFRHSSVLKRINVDTADLTEEWQKLEPTTGHRFADLQRVVIGVAGEFSSDDVMVVGVMHFKGPARGPGKKPDADLGSSRREEKVGRFTIFVEDGEEPSAVCKIDAETAIIGTPELVRAVLQRDAPAKLPEKLEAAFSRLRPTSDFAFAAVLPENWITPEVEESLGVAAELLRGIEAVSMEAGLDSDVDLRLAAVCRDEQTAYQLKGIATAVWAVIQACAQESDAETRAVLQSARLPVRDRTFAFELSVPASCLDGLIDSSEDSLSISLNGEDDSATEISPTQWLSEARPAEGGGLSSSDPPFEGRATGYATPCPPSAVACPSGPTTRYSASGYSTPVYANPYGSAAPSYAPTAPPSAVWRPVPAPMPRPTLDLEDVVRLAEAEVDEQVILRFIQGRQLAAPLSADDLILLTEKKLSVDVIVAIQNLPVDPPKSQPAAPSGGPPAFGAGASREVY